MGRLPVAIAIISFDCTLLSSYELDFLAPPAPLSTEVLSRHLQLWCTPYIVQIHFLGDITVSFDWCYRKWAMSWPQTAAIWETIYPSSYNDPTVQVNRGPEL